MKDWILLLTYLVVGWEIEYSVNGRPLVTVEKSTQYADQVHLS